ncbi:MAG: hypothetical protein K2N38_00325 [Oscillospiraceae bacterium]|nr:hypothetical protein [Oscillospiraceae bacterium]
MNKIIKRVAAIVIALAVMVTAVVFDVPERIVVEAASSAGGCNGTHSGMTAWNYNSYLPSDPGSYYLTTDVNVSSVTQIKKGDVTLCLNGCKIDAGQRDTSIFQITNRGTTHGKLTLCDCKGSGKLTGTKTYYENASAVEVDEECSFIMNGGTISGNNAISGGAVKVYGSFTMNGGTISGNTAYSGGGVDLLGTFIMNGGTISGNTATTDGGGVYIALFSSYSFTMNGGTISGNTAGKEGGGVYQQDEGKITLNGNVKITGNTKNGSASNVYLRNAPITIGNNFSSSSSVGVSVENPPSKCTNYVDVTKTTSKDVSGCFTPDGDNQRSVYNNSKVRLTGPHGTISHTTAKDASCAANGNVEYWRCSTCRKNFSDSACKSEITNTAIDKLPHTTVTDKAVAPTCTETGKTEGSHCSVCKAVITAQTTVPANGHTTVTDNAVAPTCTKTGLTEGSHCSVCDTVIKAQETVDPAGHKWSDNYEHTAEQHWKACTECQTEDEKSGHNWDDGTETKAATEYEEGETLYTCGDCGETRTEPITKLPHTHKWSDEWTFDENYHWHECTEAELHESEVHGEEIAHDWVLDEVIQAATCTETGAGKYVCFCGAEKNDDIPIDPLAHTEVIDNAVEPTCTETGLTEGKHCTECKAVIVEQTEIDELGHTEETDKAVAPTCTETGLTEGSHCSVCGETIVEQESVDALGHTEETDEAV